jgi:hypothetical protein
MHRARALRSTYKVLLGDESMSAKSFREHAGWLSQLTAATSLIIVVFVRSKFIFELGNDAAKLLSIATGAALLTLVLGIAALPRWQGFVAMSVFFVVAYCLLFVSLYAIP